MKRQSGIALRDVAENDLPIFFEHQRDPDASRMAAFPPRDWDAFLVHWRTKVLSREDVRKKAILVDEEVAGNIMSWMQDGRRLVGFWIEKGHWGRGVATAALAEFVALHEIYDRSMRTSLYTTSVRNGYSKSADFVGWTAASRGAQMVSMSS